MELVPSERAVLNMIRALIVESQLRTHRVTTLRSRWPAMHAEAYDRGYVGLIAKHLILVSQDNQIFSVTSAALTLLGMRKIAA